MKADFCCSFLKPLEENNCVIMSAVGYSIPEAARLHIRISDSDDDSDGEVEKSMVLSTALLPLLINSRFMQFNLNLH